MGVGNIAGTTATTVPSYSLHGVMASQLGADLRTSSAASRAVVDTLLAFMHAEREKADSGGYLGDPGWADSLFGAVWEAIVDVSVSNGRQAAVFSFAQAVENLTWELSDQRWERVHRGAHYYNVGLAYVARMELDRAFKFFLLADEQDETNKGAAPGDLFRDGTEFANLRRIFFVPWLSATAPAYHGSGSTADRYDGFVTLLSAIPDRHVLARCQLGVYRACILWHQFHNSMPSEIAEFWMAIEDLGVLTEAVARMYEHNGATAFNVHETLGDVLKPGRPVCALGFSLARPKADVTDALATRALLADARSGAPDAIGRVVQTFRNLSAHSSPPPMWLQTPGDLQQVIDVQLDFIGTLAAAYVAANSRAAVPIAAVALPPPPLALPIVNVAPYLSSSNLRQTK